MEDVTRLSRCARCGAPLAADADAGLCAACATAVTEARTVLLAATPDVPGDDLTVAGPRGGQIAGGDAATVLATRTIPPRPARSPKLGPGQMFGPYRIERLLGRGGMGEVYEAEHVEHGRRLALKVLTGHFAGPEDRARFLREGELAASINDPNTVYVYGSEEIDGAPVITMELLPRRLARAHRVGTRRGARVHRNLPPCLHERRRGRTRARLARQRHRRRAGVSGRGAVGRAGAPTRGPQDRMARTFVVPE